MANAIKLNEGTAKVFKASGGDAVFTFTSVASGAGRQSDLLDLGAAPRAKWYRWVLKTKFAASPTLGLPIRPYLLEASSNAATYLDGGGVFGTSDAAVSSEAPVQYAGKSLGPCQVQVASTAAQVFSGKVRIFARYVAVVVWNASGAAASSTAGDHEFRLEPVYDEVQ